jgi:hypothetical protein
MMQGADATEMKEDDASSDSEDRRQDFFARHGGVSRRANRHEAVESGVRGWSEVYAADGYTLRCDWSRTGTRNELAYSEIPPRAAVGTDETG